MFFSDNFFHNRSLSSLCDISSLCPAVGVFANDLSESESASLREEIESMVLARLSEAGIARGIGDESPILIVGVNSRKVSTADARSVYPMFRVELSIRDWLESPRSQGYQIPAEIWRSRSTVNSLPSNVNSASTRKGIILEIDRQLSDLRNALTLSRVTEAAHLLSSRLPSIRTMFDKYPQGTVEDVADLIGGQVGRNIRDPNQPEYKNTCAIRVSRSLNYAGAPIDRTVSGVRSNSGSDGKWYVFGIRDLKTYLTEKYGRPESKPISATAADFAGKRGIIAYGNYHVDLWDNDKPAGQSYFGDAHVRDPILFWAAPQ